MPTFTPYIEAPFVRNSVPVSGGMNISSTSNVLQGSEITSIFRKYGGVLPVGQSSLGSNLLEQTYFYKDKDYDDSTPFNDRYPILLSDTFSDVDNLVFYFESENFSINGTVEPFPVKEIIIGNSTEGPVFSKGPKGSMPDGNVRSDDKSSNLLSQFYEFKILSTGSYEPYEDADFRLGTLLTASVLLPGLLTLDRKKIFPYDDSKDRNRLIPVTNLSISNALYINTGTIDDEFIPVNKKSASSGFVYYDNSYGTDSIAFGGFLL